MKDFSIGQPSNGWQDTALNNKALESVEKMGRAGDPKALREMANQFESLFIQQMFKSMRAASEVFSEDSYLKSSETDFYQDMLDKQFSLNLSKGKGIGLAESMYKQMMHSYGDNLQPVNTEHKAQSMIHRPKPTVEASQSVDLSTLSQQAFVDEIRPLAKRTAQRLNIPEEGVIAQVALETGWGKYVLQDENGETTNNLFNIKAGKGWDKDTITVSTVEFTNNQPRQQMSAFKKYDSLEESFADYENFLQKSRYKAVLHTKNNPSAFTDGLQAAGYATDPHYSEKLQSILKTPYLQTARAQSETSILPTEGEG